MTAVVVGLATVTPGGALVGGTALVTGNGSASTLYTDASGVTPAGNNHVTVGAGGVVSFYAAPGLYDVSVPMSGGGTNLVRGVGVRAPSLPHLPSVFDTSGWPPADGDVFSYDAATNRMEPAAESAASGLAWVPLTIPTDLASWTQDLDTYPTQVWVDDGAGVLQQTDPGYGAIYLPTSHFALGAAIQCDIRIDSADAPGIMIGVGCPTPTDALNALAAAGLALADNTFQGVVWGRDIFDTSIAPGVGEWHTYKVVAFGSVVRYFYDDMDTAAQWGYMAAAQTGAVPVHSFLPQGTTSTIGLSAGTYSLRNLKAWVIPPELPA